MTERSSARRPGEVPRERLAFFGGSFDPPHRGHLELAVRVVGEAGLARLYFVPAARNPHKESGPLAPGTLRREMLEAAIAGDPRLGIIDWELSRPPPSRTLETVDYLRKRFPATDLCWVIGSDQLPDLPRWHGVNELVEGLTFLVLRRPGASHRPPPLPGLRLEWVKAPTYGVSSTEIRERLARGLSVDNLVPLAVLDLIRRHPETYRAPTS